MNRRRLQRYLPTADQVREVRALGWFGEALFHPALWHLNRRSAAGAVAAGLFCGLIPGPLQMLAAAVVALTGRVNLPLALFTTLYTNPLTIVPLYIAAYAIGAWVLGVPMGDMAAPPHFNMAEPIAWAHAMVDWVGGLGTPLALGLVLLASGLALAGYLVVRVAWSLHLRHAWRRRAARRRRVPVGAAAP